MYSMFKDGFMTIIMILICVTIGESLKCYVCNSAFVGQENCTDVAPGWKDYKSDCQSNTNTAGAVVCRKTITNAKDAHENQTLKEAGLEDRIVRGCGKEKRKDQDKVDKYGCYIATSNKGVKSTVCECSTDYCNEGYRTTSISSPLIVTVLLLVFAAIHN